MMLRSGPGVRHGSLPFELEQFMSELEIPLASLAAQERKARVEALLDRYLEGVDFQGTLERARGLFKDITPAR